MSLLEVQPQVQRLCFRVLRHAQDAEDATQQALLRISARAPEFTDDRAFQAWAYRVALNCALDVRRSSRRRAEVERAAAQDRGAPSKSETDDSIHEALAKMEDGQRLLLVNRYFQGRTLQDLARQEHCSTVAIWKRIEKAKTELKESLGALGFGVFVPRVDAHLATLVGEVAMTKGTLTAAAVTLAVVCLGVGGGVGATIQKRRATETPPSTRAVAVPTRPSADLDAPGSSSVDGPVLASTESSLREEVVRLRNRVEELETSRGNRPPAQDPNALAQEIYEEFLKLAGKSEREVDILKVLRRLEECNPAMASFFIERFLKAGNRDVSFVGLLLALFCGGPEVERLVTRILDNDASLPEEAREGAFRVIALRGEGVFPIDKYTLNGALLDSVLRSAASPDAHRRGAALRLLETQQVAPDCRPRVSTELLKLTATEQNPELRHAAYRAILRVGDPTAVEYVRGLSDYEKSLRPK